MEKQNAKVFLGGLSWETTGEKLRQYFENYGVVREAFVSYNRNNGRPRGFGFVVFESPEVADKVVSQKHMIDRREVEAKKAVPKEEQPSSPPSGTSSNAKTRKIFVGGLAPGVDDKLLRHHFEQFGSVEDAVVMYDHDNKRPRGFGFVTFAAEESVDSVFSRGSMQTILDKQIEIKAAVPRDQMPPAQRPAGFYDQRGPGPYGGAPGPRSSAYPYGPQPGFYGGGAGAGRGGYGGGRGGFVPTAAGGRGGRFGSGGGGQYGAPPYGPGGMQGSKLGGAYDMYSGLPNGPSSMFGSNPLYANLGLPPGVNGMQGPAAAAAAAAAGMSSKLNQFGNNLNLKALGALASSFAAFPGAQGDSTYQGDDAAAAAAAGGYGGDGTDFAADAVSSLNAASAAAAAAGLSAMAAGDFSSFRTGDFTSSPAPGWSS